MINTLVQLIVITPSNHSYDRQLLIFASLQCFSLSEFLEVFLTQYTLTTNCLSFPNFSVFLQGDQSEAAVKAASLAAVNHGSFTRANATVLCSSRDV